MVKYQNTVEKKFAALAQPVRRGMVERLAKHGSLSLTDTVSQFAISLPAALKHSEILEHCGLITREKKGRTQYLSLNSDAFEEVALWLTSQKSFWDASFDRLERHLSKKTGIIHTKKK